MPVIDGVYLKDFTALPGAVADANIIPIAITGDNIAYRTTVAGIVTDARITAKLLTGLSITGGAVVAADTILQAFGKVQNQINGKQGTITLTTLNTSGAATLIGSTLNIPNYADGGVLSLSAIGATGNANAATITGTVLNLQPANASFGGVVTTGTQTFAGAKTFSVDLTVNGLNIGKGLNSVSTNTSIGVSALNANTTGGVNTAIGRFALTANTEGNFNTAVGASALVANTTGSSNSAFGYVSLNANTEGNFNAAIGNLSLTANTTGVNNSAIGYSALASNTTGSNNVGVGHYAGSLVNAATDNITSGTSVYIGADTRASASGNQNEIVIGYEGRGNGSNTVTIGNSSIANNYFIGNVNGGAFIKLGGTSAQFLKADGTVDSVAYGTGSVTSVAALTLGTSGTDLSSTVATGTTTPVITLNVPDASSANRGVVTTGTQTFAGDKTLTGSLAGTSATFSGAGSFSGGASGVGLSVINTTNARVMQMGFSTGAGSHFLQVYDGSSFQSLVINNALTIASAGAATFSSSVTAAGFVFIGLDGTYGPTYSGISFQGTSAGVNGENRIFAGRAGADGLYLASATSRAIYFRAGGSTSDHLTIGSTGAATFSSTATATAFIPSGATVPTNGMYLSAANTLNFATNTTSRLSINSSGAATFSAGGALLAINSTNNNTFKLRIQDSGTDRGYLGGDATNAWVFGSNAAASIATINNSTGEYTALSDFNKKKDFEESTIGLNEVLGLKPTLYRMKTESNDTDKHLGFIAQEIKEFIPQAYVESGEDKDKFIGLNYNAIVAALVKGMQEQQAQIEELKALIK